MRNSCLVIASSFVLLGAVACSGTATGSGTLDGGDADGSADDASTQADGGPVSLPPPKTGSGDAGKAKPPMCVGEEKQDGPEGNCTLESTTQCESPTGFDAFRVACDCPGAACDCYINGTRTKTVPFNGCPACTSPVALGKLCGFQQ